MRKLLVRKLVVNAALVVFGYMVRKGYEGGKR